MSEQNLAALVNGLDEAGGREALRRCCGATAWVEAMLALRPFDDDAMLLAAADEVWRALEPADWVEAFNTHPRIGDRSVEGWSGDEQSGLHRASSEVATRLRELNGWYEERFGHVFLISATNRTAEEILAELVRRLGNDPDTELFEAAGEQLAITRLRLGKLAR